MTLQHFAIQSIFTEDEYDLEWYSIPDEIKKILQSISDDIYNEQVYYKIPNQVREMIALDDLKDEPDNYKFFIDDGLFRWYSNFMTFYLDINQWMLLDPKTAKEYEFKVSNAYYSCELCMEITHIYEKPTLNGIYLDVSMEGDVESFELYPNCGLKYPMTKKEIISKFGEDAYKEED